MLDHYFQVRTGANPSWMICTMPKYAAQEAGRLRNLHNQIPIAFPLPISVWSVNVDARDDSVFSKRVRGRWERGCECKACRKERQLTQEAFPRHGDFQW